MDSNWMPTNLVELINALGGNTSWNRSPIVSIQSKYSDLLVAVFDIRIPSHGEVAPHVPASRLWVLPSRRQFLTPPRFGLFGF